MTDARPPESKAPLDTGQHKRYQLAKVRHELRTPINHIIGYSEMLQELANDQGKLNFVSDLHRIQLAARNLLTQMEEHLLPSPGLAEGKIAFDGAGAQAEPSSDTEMVFRLLEPRGIAGLDATQGSLLVVDDDEANRNLLSRRLERQGYKV